MRLTYDPRYNIAYLGLRDKVEPVETVRVSDELHIDMAPDGTVYGIELLNANRQLRFDENNGLTALNIASGATSELKLPF